MNFNTLRALVSQNPTAPQRETHTLEIPVVRANTHHPAAGHAPRPRNHFFGECCTRARSKFMWGAMAAFLLCADAAGQGPFTCTSNSAVTPTMRAEGYTERTGDIVLICSGGAPPPSGTILPTTNFTLFLNTAVTSRIQDVTTDASE